MSGTQWPEFKMRARTPDEVEDHYVAVALAKYLERFGPAGRNEWDFIDYVVAQVFLATEGEKVTFWAQKAQEWAKAFPPESHRQLEAPSEPTRSKRRRRDR